MKPRRTLIGRLTLLMLTTLLLHIASAQSASKDKRYLARFDFALNESMRFYDLGRFEDAIAAAQGALQVNPDSAEAYNNMAVAYAGLRNWDDAIESIQKALRLKPDFQLAKNNLAWFRSEKDSPIAVKRSIPSAESWLELSLYYYRTHRFRECIHAAEEALNLQVDFAEAHNNLGAAYASLGQWDQAIDALWEALRINPDFQLAKNNLAWAETEKRKLADSSK